MVRVHMARLVSHEPSWKPSRAFGSRVSHEQLVTHLTEHVEAIALVSHQVQQKYSSVVGFMGVTTKVLGNAVTMCMEQMASEVSVLVEDKKDKKANQTFGDDMAKSVGQAALGIPEGRLASNTKKTDGSASPRTSRDQQHD
jgi:predicted DNA-binding protein (UPF0251 family)